MATISSTSLTTGLDTLFQRAQDKQNKLVAPLKSRKSALEKKSTVLTDLKSNLKELRTRAKSFSGVGSEAKLRSKSAVSSDDSIFTVQVDSTAPSGVNTLAVSRIARNDIAVTDTFNKTGSNLANKLAGSQRFTVAVGAGAAQTVAFTVNEGDSNEDVLDAVAEAVNSLVDGVSAKVIASDKNSVRLTIVSDETGSEYALTIAAEDDDLLKTLGISKNGGDFERDAFSGSQGGYLVESADDLDARFALNGIEIVSSSNTVDDVIQGVTITLRKTQEAGAEPETFSVTQDADEIISQIEGFIEDYNETLNYLQAKTRVNVTDNERGELAGDFTYRRLRLDLRTIVSAPVAGVEEGNPELITEVGIAIGSDGTLSIDDRDALEEAILDDADAVTDLFDGTDGVAVQLEELLDNFTSAGAAIDKNVNAITSQTQTIQTQIDRFESRSKVQETSLRRQYTKLQQTLALLNSQQALLQRFGLPASITPQSQDRSPFTLFPTLSF